MTNKKYQILIAGGGITGSALLYTLSKLPNIKNIALIEKNSELGSLNSSSLRNSQTLHFGDIETNYSLEKAKVVNQGAQMVADYLEKLPNNDNIFSRTQSMILAVGEKEVAKLNKRYEDFKVLFPDLQRLERAEIEKLEPKLIEGRDANVPILALYSKDRYTVDYKKLCNQFVVDSQKNKKGIDLYFNTKIKQIIKTTTGYEVFTDDSKYEADVVVIAMGAHSLLFAKQLGYGLEYSLLPVIGDYFSTNKPLLTGKVYTMQNEKLPFAAIHGDPNILNLNETRFGPTALSLPILERGSMKTFFEFLSSTGLDWNSIASVIKINSDKEILKFVLENLIYTLPIIGRWMFVRTLRKIIPTIKLSDLQKEKGIGGIRPQLVNKKERRLLLGAAEILGDNIIFNVTPSPGATACLQTAQRMTTKILEFLQKQ